MDSRELTEWSLLFDIKADEEEARRAGGIIEHGGERTDPEEDEHDDDDDGIPEGEPDWLTAPSRKPE